MGDFMDQIYNNLTKLIKKYNNFIIMTHKNPDFDGIASSICLQQIIYSFKKESYILINNSMDNSLKEAIKLLKENNVYINTTNKTNVDKLINDDTMIIVLDTYKTSLVEDYSILNNKNIVVIDHHIKSKDYIKTTIFEYINQSLSSIIEFMTFYLKYLNKNVDKLVATYMMLGLEIDTNNFRLKTTDKTYEAASYLYKMGPDNVLKQKLLKEPMANFIKRCDLIKNAHFINNKFSVCILDDKIYKKHNLAQIALELLQFDKIEASFVIGYLDNDIIGISSRSIGDVNVEAIMVQLGGGGHLYEAAAEFKTNDIDDVKNKLLEVIR